MIIPIPPVRPIVFTGSSIVALWESLPTSLRGIPILNTAVSGSQTADILARLDELVTRHQPRMVCYYCGSNDINASVPPVRIIEQVQTTYTQLRQAIPDLRFVYLSIIKAPQKRERWDQVDFVNTSLQQTPGLAYIDINPVFFASNGESRLDFYVEDLLHHTPEAYQALNAYLLPRLTDELRHA